MRIMKFQMLLLAILTSILLQSGCITAAESSREHISINEDWIFYKYRVIILTDIENEPDDAMSMVRFLTYSNHYDIEGLVATTSIHQRGRVAPQRIRRIVEAYGKVRDNLEKHEPGFPTAEFLLGRISEGIPV